MQKPRIQRVRSVPPMPTTTIVNPNVQLSILRYLLITFGGHGLFRDDPRILKKLLAEQVRLDPLAEAARKEKAPVNRKAKQIKGSSLAKTT